MLDERNIEAHIEVDGGVGLQNAEILLEAGANVLVAGNTVFSASDPHEMISRLKHLSANKFADF
jgi:ribulose-phosphate 3-epimerase